jgi:hypothetical protein
MSILDDFLSQDCDVHARREILHDIGRYSESNADVNRDYTFNRFVLHLDFRRKEAIIEDDLDASESGVLRLPLVEFASALIDKFGTV